MSVGTVQIMMLLTKQHKTMNKSTITVNTTWPKEKKMLNRSFKTEFIVSCVCFSTLSWRSCSAYSPDEWQKWFFPCNICYGMANFKYVVILIFLLLMFFFLSFSSTRLYHSMLTYSHQCFVIIKSSVCVRGAERSNGAAVIWLSPLQNKAIRKMMSVMFIFDRMDFINSNGQLSVLFSHIRWVSCTTRSSPDQFDSQIFSVDFLVCLSFFSHRFIFFGQRLPFFPLMWLPKRPLVFSQFTVYTILHCA